MKKWDLLLKLKCGCRELVVIEAETLMDAVKKAKEQYPVQIITRGELHKDLFKCPIHGEKS